MIRVFYLNIREYKFSSYPDLYFIAKRAFDAKTYVSRLRLGKGVLLDDSLAEKV
jgi:hypothetical protein